jgi:hypothetical protein
LDGEILSGITVTFFLTGVLVVVLGVAFVAGFAFVFFAVGLAIDGIFAGAVFLAVVFFLLVPSCAFFAASDCAADVAIIAAIAGTAIMSP